MSGACELVGDGPAVAGHGGRVLVAAERREGWHLEAEPVIEPDEPDDAQRMWVERRSEAQQ